MHVLIFRPERPVNVHQGQLLSCWFDTISLPPAPDEFDETGISESIAIIDSPRSNLELTLNALYSSALVREQRWAWWSHWQWANLHTVWAESGWIPPRTSHVRILCPNNLTSLIQKFRIRCCIVLGQPYLVVPWRYGRCDTHLVRRRCPGVFTRFCGDSVDQPGMSMV
jgi:hypothetical protein